MMKHLLATILLLAAFVPCLSAGRPYVVEVGKFSKLEIPNNLTVVYRCHPDSVGKARYECPDMLAGAVMFSNSGNGSLKVQISPDFIDREHMLPVIYVYSEFLSEVVSSSERRVSVYSPARCSQFKGVLMGNGTLDLHGLDCDKAVGVLASGNGTVILRGKCDSALLKLTGTGRVDAFGMDAGDVVCQTLGTGDITCRFSKSLVQKGLGSTTIHYKGDPGKVRTKGLAKFNHVPDCD